MQLRMILLYDNLSVYILSSELTGSMGYNGTWLACLKSVLKPTHRTSFCSLRATN